jgi:hypothetical protein
MPIGNAADQHPIYFLVGWCEFIPSPQAGFNMAYRYPAIKCRKSAAEGCGRIALDNDKVGFISGQISIYRGMMAFPANAGSRCSSPS